MMASTSTVSSAAWAKAETAAKSVPLSATTEMITAATAIAASTAVRGTDTLRLVVRNATTTSTRFKNADTDVAQSWLMPDTMNVSTMIASSRPNRSVGFDRASFIVQVLLRGARCVRNTPTARVDGRWAGSANDRDVLNPHRSRTACGPKISSSGSTRCVRTRTNRVACCVCVTPSRWSSRAIGPSTICAIRCRDSSDLRPHPPRRHPLGDAAGRLQSPSATSCCSPTTRLTTRPPGCRPPSSNAAEPAAEEEPPVVTGHEHAHVDHEHGGAAEATPWTPSFDESDDLNGLLAARSPLLARAFRGGDRPKPA